VSCALALSVVSPFGDILQGESDTVCLNFLCL
jgi:hypothetical protein